MTAPGDERRRAVGAIHDTLGTFGPHRRHHHKTPCLVRLALESAFDAGRRAGLEEAADVADRCDTDVCVEHGFVRGSQVVDAIRALLNGGDSGMET